MHINLPRGTIYLKDVRFVQVLLWVRLIKLICSLGLPVSGNITFALHGLNLIVY